MAALGSTTRVIGVADDNETDIKRSRVLHLANSAPATLDLPARVSAADIEVLSADPNVYSKAEPETFEAIRLLARCEGLVADPVYEGKALRGLQQLARDGRFRPDSNILLMHPDGTPTVHGYADQFGRPTLIPL